LVAVLALAIFSCKNSNQKAVASDVNNPSSSCVKEGPEVDLMKKQSPLIVMETGQQWHLALAILHCLIIMQILLV